MIHLWLFPAANEDVPSLSPFCMKAHTYLTMLGEDFETMHGDPRKAPTKKLPAIDDNGTLVGDSTRIIDYLVEKHGDKFDVGLSADQLAHGRMVQRTVEEGLYFVMLYARWLDDEAWPEMERLIRPMLPPVVGGALLKMIRKGIHKTLWLQGTSRHSKADVYAMGQADLTAIAELMDTEYAVADHPTSYDAMLYGFLMNIRRGPGSTPLREHLETLPVLVEYVERMKGRYFA